jgi:hypothetical protein
MVSLKIGVDFGLSLIVRACLLAYVDLNVQGDAKTGNE